MFVRFWSGLRQLPDSCTAVDERNVLTLRVLLGRLVEIALALLMRPRKRNKSSASWRK